jgi:DNA polymerase-3 subunit delta
VDKRLKAVDALRNRCLIVEFPYARPEELTGWVTRRFKAEGIEIDAYTASQLVETCEQSMTDMLNEIEKLTAYLGGRKNVTGQDIEKVCTMSIKARIFDLTDAIADKKSARALELLSDMITLKEPVQKILYMITRQFRQILQVKLLKDEGNTPDGIAAKLKLTPFIAGKLIRQAGRFDTEKLKQAVEAALEFDLAVKTGRIVDRMAAELMIIEFSK